MRKGLCSPSPSAPPALILPLNGDMGGWMVTPRYVHVLTPSISGGDHGLPKPAYIQQASLEEKGEGGWRREDGAETGGATRPVTPGVQGTNSAVEEPPAPENWPARPLLGLTSSSPAHFTRRTPTETPVSGKPHDSTGRSTGKQSLYLPGIPGIHSGPVTQAAADRQWLSQPSAEQKWQVGREERKRGRRSRED